MSIKLKHSKRVKDAIKHSRPILALESTIIAHGMPYPRNLAFALEAESLCEKAGAVPATIAIINGEVCVGLDRSKLKTIATSSEIKKISFRELGLATSLGWSGATTVSSTMHIAKNNNIDVFATGGIGGVHREIGQSLDISQDLVALSNTPMIVVSAGAKSVLDLPKTLEALETLGVCLVGFKTGEFPSFYSRKSGLRGLSVVRSAQEISNIFLNNQLLGLPGATLVANPISREHEIPIKKMDSIINKTLEKLKKENIRGKLVTPFMLKNILKESEGKSLEANISLALNNVRLGAKIAKNLNKKKKQTRPSHQSFEQKP